MTARDDFIIIQVEGEEWGRIHKKILGKTVIPLKFESKEEFEELFCKWELSGARRYALMRLSMKSHSIYELRDQLEQKGMSAGIIEQVIEEFIKQGYLNDQEWVDAFIRGQQSRHTGPRSIQRKLRQKGISEDQIREALLRAGLKENQGCQIKKLLTARYKSKDLNDLKQKQKVIAALIRKGFDLDEIFRSIQTAKENPGF